MDFSEEMSRMKKFCIRKITMNISIKIISIRKDMYYKKRNQLSIMNLSKRKVFKIKLFLKKSHNVELFFIRKAVNDELFFIRKAFNDEPFYKKVI